MRSILSAAVVALVVLSGALPASAADQAFVSPIPGLTAQDLAAGQQLFRLHCARCHGMLGEGGEGPSLKRARLQHAADDEALFDVITNGIAGTGMPATWSPNDAERWQIAGYVRSLGALPPEPMPGDPERGRLVYETRGGCGSCHIAAGAGRGVGPELTEVGLRRNAGYLRRALVNPDADYPMLSSQITGRINAFLTVRVVSADGEFEGLRVSEDEFSIQMRDLSGVIHSFDKRSLLSFDKAFDHSLMPGYDATLSETDVNDVVSYLMTLRGAPQEAP
ncbi:MAG: c-type cytochrome [Pseudomonadales bacterium]